MTTRIKHSLAISFSVIFGSVALVSVALYIFSQSMTTEVSKIKTDRALINAQIGALTSLAALQSQAPAAAGYQDAMARLLPTQDGLISFGQWIARIGAADQVDARVAFRGESDILPAGDAPGQASFNFDVTGPLGNLTAFLEDIEAKAPGYLLSISSFDLVNASAEYHLVGQGSLFFRP